MRFLITTLFAFLLFSCVEKQKVHIEDFRTGKFKTTLEDDETTSIATRNDSLQIEEYLGKNDTFKITWIDQFEYVLVKQSPKSLLDSTPFHVKITAIKNNSYSFSAHYRGSKFKQKGRAEKLE